jgi:hypothetical protein
MSRCGAVIDYLDVIAVPSVLPWAESLIVGGEM